MYIFEEQWGAHDIFKFKDKEEIKVYLYSRYLPFFLFNQFFDNCFSKDKSNYILYLEYMTEIKESLDNSLRELRECEHCDCIIWDYFDDVYYSDDNTIINSRSIKIVYEDNMEDAVFVIKELWGANDIVEINNDNDLRAYIAAKYFPYSLYKDLSDISKIPIPFNIYLFYTSEIRDRINEQFEELKKEGYGSIKDYDYADDKEVLWDDNLFISYRPIKIAYLEKKQECYNDVFN